MRAPLLLVLCLASSSVAKPWQGIDPGDSKRAEVVAKFGEPTKVVPLQGKEILAYMGPKAIKGTQQAQFRIDNATQTVERIDVFPDTAIQIGKEAIENSYGKECAQGQSATPNCYVKKMGDDFNAYFLYSRLGLAVFFDKEGKNVSSLVFTPPKGAPIPAKEP